MNTWNVLPVGPPDETTELRLLDATHRVLDFCAERSIVGTVFVVIAIGTVIGTLYLSGTVAAFIYYGSDIISPRFFFVTVFLIASGMFRKTRSISSGPFRWNCSVG